MTQQSPLSQTTTDPFERALLESVQCDNPGPHALRRTAGALGIGAAAFAGVGTATGATTGATTGVTAGALSGAVMGSTAVGTVGLKVVALKAIVVGAMCGVVAMAGQRFVKSYALPPAAPVSEAAPKSRPPSATAVSEAAPIARTQSAATVSEAAPKSRPPSASAVAPPRPVESESDMDPDTEVAHPLHPALEPKRAPASARPRREMPATPPAGVAPVPSEPITDPPRSVLHQATVSSVAEETACVDRARQAIRENRGQAALLELAGYQRRWPNGVFAMECAILRVEALLSVGNRTAAERDANAILATHPNSRYAARLRAVFGQHAPAREK